MRQLIATADLAHARATGARVLHRYGTSRVLVDGPEPVGERVDGETVWVNGRAVTVPEGAHERGSGPRVLVRFAGPVVAAWTRRLHDLGAPVAEWCPPLGACLTLDDRPLPDLPWWVAGVVPYDTDQCLRPPLTAAVPPLRADGAGPTGSVDAAYADVVCFTQPDRAAVERRLAGLGVQVVDRSSTKLRIVPPLGGLDQIRALPGVKLADPARGARTLLTVATPLAALPPDVDGVAAAIGMGPGLGAELGLDVDGGGEVVAVIDTGLDTGDRSSLSGDFAGRVRRLVSWPINPSWSALVTNPGADDGAADRSSGHGTYVAGLAVGTGAGSGGRHHGIAPGAALVFQAIEQWAAVGPAHAATTPPGYYLAGRPLDLRDLFARSTAGGATIHVNAWGDPAGGAYTNDAYEADLYLHEHPGALILFAAGNGGSDPGGDREIDPGSLDSPASAKNVLTIGATEGPRYGVGFLGTWTSLQGGGAGFGAVADRQDGVSGSPDRMALLSSTGPTSDGRTKPDLCTVGTNLAGPRSSVAAGHGWAYADPAPAYIYWGGTSAAVGIAGGAAAVLRQQWRAAQRPGRAPLGVTLKALAIVGAAPVLRRDGSGPELRRIAGYGRVNVAGSSPAGPDHRTVVLSDGGRGLTTGATRCWLLSLPTPGPLRVALTWYDAPGERLVNDLDLRVQDPGGVTTWGNHPAGATGVADRTNNVEVVDLPSVAAGHYVVTVDGFNVPSGSQPFALVARGPVGLTARRAVTPPP